MEDTDYRITGRPIKLLGAPYYLMEDDEEGLYNIVESIAPTSDGAGFCEFSESLESLAFDQDIVEVKNTLQLSLSLYHRNNFGIRVAQGLRTLAKSIPEVLYVTPLIVNPNQDIAIPIFDGRRQLFLVRPRFFKRKFDLGFDPHQF